MLPRRAVPRPLRRTPSIRAISHRRIAAQGREARRFIHRTQRSMVVPPANPSVDVKLEESPALVLMHALSVAQYSMAYDHAALVRIRCSDSDCYPHAVRYAGIHSRSRPHRKKVWSSEDMAAAGQFATRIAQFHCPMAR